MRKLILTILVLVTILKLNAQLVDVQADYNAMGDCVFTAYNNTLAPVFLNIKFADLENTTFSEPLPYVKKLSPGFNNLFTLLRDQEADVPRFHYEIKVFRSNPIAKVDLQFPYLIPFEEGKHVKYFDVKEIDGFWGSEGLESWLAVGFYAQPGEDVYATRNGEVVEIVGKQRTGNSELWYHTWTNSVTLLQADGTLVCYHNVTMSEKELKIGDMVYAGQKFAKISNGADNLKLLIYHRSLFADGLLFVVPEFVTDENGKHSILNASSDYAVNHPYDTRALEMSKKELKKILGKRK